MEREEIKKELRAAREARDEADHRYWVVMRQAKEAGMSASEAARVMGVSEAAVRLYWKRNVR